jgi:hypothetical protein
VQDNGQRLKIGTADGVMLDCMYFDRRPYMKSERANTLVITCEGNASFYEGSAGMTSVW